MTNRVKARGMVAALLCVLLVFAPNFPLAAEDAGSPHFQRLPDGSPDTEKCGFCHEEDLSLSRTKEETCTLCHEVTTHAGAAEHLRASPASVRAALERTRSKADLPLREDGGIYCGTCHLFHDPVVMNETPEKPWLPSSAVARATRRALEAEFARLAGKARPTFAEKGTGALRLPVRDGTLCRQCHEAP